MSSPLTTIKNTASNRGTMNHALETSRQSGLLRNTAHNVLLSTMQLHYKSKAGVYKDFYTTNCQLPPLQDHSGAWVTRTQVNQPHKFLSWIPDMCKQGQSSQYVYEWWSSLSTCQVHEQTQCLLMNTWKPRQTATETTAQSQGYSVACNITTTTTFQEYWPVFG
jgi:hypothetical protein